MNDDDFDFRRVGFDFDGGHGDHLAVGVVIERVIGGFDFLGERLLLFGLDDRGLGLGAERNELVHHRLQRIDQEINGGLLGRHRSGDDQVVTRGRYLRRSRLVQFENHPRYDVRFDAVLRVAHVSYRVVLGQDEFRRGREVDGVEQVDDQPPAVFVNMGVVFGQAAELQDDVYAVAVRQHIDGIQRMRVVGGLHDRGILNVRPQCLESQELAISLLVVCRLRRRQEHPHQQHDGG